MTPAQGAMNWRYAVVRSYTIQLAPRFPVALALRIPFSRHWIQFGRDSLDRLRRRVQRNPADANTHITLATRLLSERPLQPSYAGQAARALRMALDLLAAGGEMSGGRAYQSAMVHKLLGDALLALGQRVQAREQWRLAVAQDPAGPPYGWGVPAQQMLDRYSDDDPGSSASGVPAPLSPPPSTRTGRDAKAWPEEPDDAP